MSTPTKTNKRLGVKVTGTPDKGQCVTVENDDTLQKLFGTDIPDVADGLLRHCIKVLKRDEITDEHAGNDERMFLVAAVTEIAPRDGVERMLAVQMAATHVAMIRAGRWMANADNLAQVQAHNNGYNKLARTYTAQMEALRKHRNGGKQTVVVQHVTVEGGGQAIVGNVGPGEGR
jgi:hypothetical protein